MTGWCRRSLTCKVAFALIAVEAAALLGLGGYFTASLNRQIDQDRLRRLRVPAYLMGRGLLAYDTVANAQMMKAVTGEDLENVVVFNVEGRVFHALRPQEMGGDVRRIPSLQGVAITNLGPEGRTWNYQTNGQSYTESVLPITAPESHAPYLWLYLKARTTEAVRAKDTLRANYLWGAGGTLLLTSLAVGWVLSRLVRRPLAGLLGVVTELARGQWQARSATPCRGDEVGRLQQGVDAMATQLEHTIGSLERSVAELRVSEAARRESEEDFRLLFDSAPVGFLLLQPADGTVLLANRQATELCGRADNESASWRLVDVLAEPEDRQALWNCLQAAPAPARWETPWKLPARDPRWVTVLTHPIRYRQRPATLVGLVDITERKRAEAERQELQARFVQSQKMESVGQLAGGVAHDFNNMLQVILGLSAMALEETPPESPQREMLQEIQRAAQRSADLTRQLLAFARKQAVNPRVLDLNEAIAQLLRMLQRLIGENIRLVWRPAEELWPVRLDPAQLDQVLVNLAVNARDAIASQGTITIETANETLGEQALQPPLECSPGQYVVLTVADTGRGMEREVRTRLFEPFFTTKEIGRGTGLGLATVFGIVKQNRGGIEVWSEPGQGARFRVYLPRAQAASAAAPSPTAAPMSLHGAETVLLVEDEEQILHMARRILTQHGYRVLASRTAQEALVLAERHTGRIHLLLTDVIMPEMDGVEVRRRVDALQPGVRCIYMSGYPAEHLAPHGVFQEGVSLLQKPFVGRQLVEAVRQALEGCPARDPS